MTENVTDSSNPADGFEDEVAGRASLSVFDPAVSTGDFLLIDPGDSTNLPLEVNEDAQGENPSKGWMIVTLDDAKGAPQAELVPVGELPVDE